MLLAVFFIFIFVLAWGFIFRHWQNGIVLLLAFLPFAGVVTLLLYPSPYPILIKDFYLVIPAYLAFFMRKSRSQAQGSIPSSVILALMALVFMVLVQSFNPDLINWMVAAIGAKVWLFYIPLLFLAYAMIESRDDLIRILRLIVAIAWIPCLVGIVQWLSSMTFGYQTTMVAFYGEAAEGATQNFARFNIGGLFFRIPSTFTFVTQYFGFTLAMLVPTYALIKLDTSMKWRKFATVVFWLVIVASFMSGARSAFLFVPIFLGLLYSLEGKISGVMKMALMLPAVFFAAMALAGIDPLKMFNMVFELFLMYSEDIAKKGLLDAISIAPFGTGTGMNTGAARYGVDDPENFIGIENYYAKVVVELGVVGLVVVVTIFIVLLKNGYNSHRKMQDLGLKSCSSAFLAFIVTMALNSFKGWQIDLDPINVYFWIFSGFMLKLPYLLESEEVAWKKKKNVSTLFYGKMSRSS